MPRKTREIDIPWSEVPTTEEEQKEFDEYEKYHTDRPEFYQDFKGKEVDEKDS